MSENQLTEKKELNIFQKLRRTFLVSTINSAKYLSAPDYLKNDEYVILTLLAKNIEDFDKLDENNKLIITKNYPEIFRKLNYMQKKKLIDVDSEYIKQLTEEDACDLIIAGDDKDKFKYLSRELQVKMLSEKFNFSGHDKAGDEVSIISMPEYYFDYIEKFDPDCVEFAILKSVKKLKDLHGTNWEDYRDKDQVISKINISKLPADTQMRIALIDSNFISKMSSYAARKFIGNNVLLVNYLSDEVKLDFVKEYPEAIRRLSFENQEKLLKENGIYKDYISDKHLLYLGRDLEYKFFDNIDELKRLIIQSQKSFFECQSIFEYTSKAELSELGKMAPEIFSTWNLSDYDSSAKINKIFDVYRYSIHDNEILKVLDSIEAKIYTQDSYSKNNYLSSIAKVLLNERVLNSVDSEEIISYIKDPCVEKLINIVGMTYGEDVKQILDENQYISIDSIPNLDIFDEKIIEKFGKNFINYLLNTKENSSKVLSEIARSPEKMNRYKLFEYITGDYFSNDNKEIENKLMQFNHFENIIEEFGSAQINDTRRKALLTAISDRMMDSEYDEELFKVDSLEDLDKYIEKRNSLYLDAINKLNSKAAIREMFARRHFGMLYQIIEHQDKPCNTSMQSIVNYFDKIDSASQEYDSFSSEEKDKLGLISVIDKIEYVEALKDMYDLYDKDNSYINPINFNFVRYKLPKQYSQELIDSLLDFYKVEEMAKAGVPGVDYRKEDDVAIIRLNGINFKMLLRARENKNNQLPVGLNETQIWKLLESNNAIIDGIVVDDEMVAKSINKYGANLGYSNLPTNQIVNKAFNKKNIKGFDHFKDYKSIKYKYADEPENVKLSHVKDRPEDYQLFKRENAGDYYPDYLVIYGKCNSTHKMLARKFARKGKMLPIIEIDIDAYKQREIYMENNTNSRRENNDQQEYIEEMRELFKNAINDGRGEI